MDDTALDGAMITGTDADVRASYLTLAERAKTMRIGLVEEQVVILDTETTGFHAGEDRLIQIAAAIMDGPDIIDRFQTFVDPDRSIPPAIVELTGITDADVVGAPNPHEAVAAFAAFAGKRTLIAHNAKFDQGFLAHETSADSWIADDSAWIDSLDLARIALPRMRAHDMHTLSRAFSVAPSTHRADDDVEALCAVWRICLVALLDMPEGLLDLLAHLFENVEWDLRPLLSTLAPLRPGTCTLATLRDARIKATTPKVKSSAENVPPSMRATITAEQIERAFSPDGLVGSIFENYEPRPEQVGFAREVATAFNESTHRALEAGTGVGKSMGYLVPAALFALSNGLRVGVATKTNALLDQLMYQELPALAQAFAETRGEDLRFVALKGYEHYPCLRKLMRFAHNENVKLSQSDIVITAMLISYIAQTTFGDLDPLPLYWNSFSNRCVTATSEECLHGKCRYYPNRCFIHGARRAAAAADVVVTNHALLFRDTIAEGNLLPPIDHWIVDEAHAVETEARSQLSLTADGSDLMESLEALVRCGGKSLVDRISKKAEGVEGGMTVVGKCAHIASDAQLALDLCDSFFSTVHELNTLDNRAEGYLSHELWISAEVREGGVWGHVAQIGSSLIKRLEPVVHDVSELHGLLDGYPEMLEAQRDLQALKSRLSCAYEALVAIINGDDDNYVFSVLLHTGDRQPHDRLIAAPIDVGTSLLDLFYPEVESVVFSSATIATGDSFEYFARSTGLDRLEPDTWSTHRFDSSYDLEHQMKVFVLTDVAEPNKLGYIADVSRACLQIHEALGGGILTLFTNKNEMRTVFDEVAPYLRHEGIELYCQGRGTSVKRLRDAFLADEHSSLFALKSFWEGFDAPGDTLRCVVLPKLPFARPDDPLICERRVRERDAWRMHILPEAIIDVKQAAGRLIRTSTDSGFLVLGDARLLSKGYGKVFLRSLPTSDVQCVTVEELADYLMTQRLPE